MDWDVEWKNEIIQEILNRIFWTDPSKLQMGPRARAHARKKAPKLIVLCARARARARTQVKLGVGSVQKVPFQIS